MTWIDLILTPLYLLVFYGLAYYIKPRVTNKHTAKHFIPGYTVKIIGAIAVGLVYQFYYSGGDTFNFYKDSTRIYQAFMESPVLGVKLLFATERYDPETAELYAYASRIAFFYDASSYFVIKLAAVVSLFTFNTYTVIACIFASVSYSGLWNLYRTFYRLYPHLNKYLAYSILFVPSVFFWGSGYLKDTVTLGAVGWAVYCVHQLFIERKMSFPLVIMLLISFYVVYMIKIYIIISLFPALVLWVFLQYSKNIKNTFVRYVVTPVLMLLAGVLGFYGTQKIGEGNHRYSLDRISYTAEATARWLTYVSEQQGGSVYTLGDFDYSTAGMIRKALPAINVTLFRPYVWEVKNVVMLLSALESLFLLLFTLYVVYKRGLYGFFRGIKDDPTVLFCLIFAIAFSFAVGVSTYNFGSLVRYKIPMLPFYLIALLVLLKPHGKRVLVKRRRKVVRLAETEKASSTVFRANSPIPLRS
ncbi:hypothetical protein D770_08310 [Flammeovirgaceae bacterium 311]|nr:hypothetical protein D770_08310 [Flammeovirgaceae bacterium 311]